MAHDDSDPPGLVSKALNDIIPTSPLKSPNSPCANSRTDDAPRTRKKNGRKDISAAAPKKRPSRLQTMQVSPTRTLPPRAAAKRSKTDQIIPRRQDSSKRKHSQTRSQDQICSKRHRPGESSKDSNFALSSEVDQTRTPEPLSSLVNSMRKSNTENLSFPPSPQNAQPARDDFSDDSAVLSSVPDDFDLDESGNPYPEPLSQIIQSQECGQIDECQPAEEANQPQQTQSTPKAKNPEDNVDVQACKRLSFVADSQSDGELSLSLSTQENSPMIVKLCLKPDLLSTLIYQTSHGSDLITPAEEYNDQENDSLWALSRQLVKNPSLTKLEPCEQPEVWADNRMELCETLYYYRSYHGACYTTGGFARAFMFSCSSHPRDYMDASVIVARAGGGLKRDETGQMKMNKDQTEGAFMYSLRNNMAQFNPVVIITADDNPNCQVQAPHPYCVLDYFKVTNMWWEKSQGKKIVRLRFEKLNSKKKSWWEPKGTTEVAKPGSLDPPVVQTCAKCKQDSQQVYLQGWMCLQPECPRFWKLPFSMPNNFKEPEEVSLTYDPRFLKQKNSWPNDNTELPLGSMNAEISGHSIMGEDCERAHWSGIVCPDCGRCTSRLKFTGWVCGNPKCTFQKTPPHVLISSTSLHDPFNPLSNSYMYSRDLHLPMVKLSVSFAYNYRINRFSIPGIDGFITHMIANKTVVEEPNGPNSMFESLQQTDIGLARRSMGHDGFTRHYAVNFGMPYKFIAATSSSPFPSSATPVTLTRSRLNWAARFVLSGEECAECTAKEFNEVLALAYYENQKINWHDDGEYGLGPTIATLSLGATGTMRIRMKSRYFNGVSKSGIYDSEPPLPGCVKYEDRVGLYKELCDLQSQDRKAYNERLRQIPKDLGLKSGPVAKDAITMTVSHGDIVIMHGEQLQKYYEHSVDHSGKLRFALTCRYIDPESLSEEDKPTWEVKPDEGKYDGTRLPVPVMA